MTKQSQTKPTHQIAIKAQYIKDLSFENPKAPGSLSSKQQRPDIDVSIDIKASKMQDDLYESVLSVTVTAKREGEVQFMTELSYAGLFAINDIPEAEIQPVLFVFCPNLLFPFARRIIADTIRDGGMPPLMLDPVDFAQLYQKRMQQLQEQATEEAKEATQH